MDFSHTELFNIQPGLTYISAHTRAPPPQDVSEFVAPGTAKEQEKGSLPPGQRSCQKSTTRSS